MTATTLIITLTLSETNPLTKRLTHTIATVEVQGIGFTRFFMAVMIHSQHLSPLLLLIPTIRANNIGMIITSTLRATTAMRATIVTRII